MLIVKHLERALLAVCMFVSLGTSSFAQEGVDDLKCLGSIQPKHARDIDSSQWGIQASTLDPVLLAKAAEIGVKWTRLGASWPSIERSKGNYDWAKTDKAFDAVLKSGITPFVTIGSGNKLYVPLSTYDDPKLAEIYGRRPGPPTSNPEAMAAWLKYVRAVVERYSEKIKYWEVWNEPNHRNYWGAPPDPLEYGRLLKETARLIKDIDPSAIVLGGSMAGLQPRFVDGFLSVGTEHLVDIITYHNYGAIPEKRIYAAAKVWEVINKYNPEIQMWQGECGYPSHSSTRDYRGVSPWGLNIQAKWLLRQAFTDTFFCRASMSNYFKLVHNGNRADRPKRSFLSDIDKVLGFPERNGSRVKTVGINEKCLLANPSLTPKPGYFAYQNLCAVMDGRYKNIEVKHQIDILDEGIFYGIGPEDDAFPSVPLVASFKTENDAFLIAHWLPWHPQEYMPKTALIDLTLEGVKFSNPVVVDFLTGKVYEVNKVVQSAASIKFFRLPLADYPFAIVERDMIDIGDH